MLTEAAPGRTPRGLKAVTSVSLSGGGSRARRGCPLPTALCQDAKLSLSDGKFLDLLLHLFLCPRHLGERLGCSRRLISFEGN